MLDLTLIDTSWTLFLDRDGVINHEKEMDYIYHFSEFQFYKGAIHALKKLSDRFGRIIVVTNQRGVGKLLMTETDLVNLHDEMQSAIRSGGGRIDAIYYCTSLENDHPNRKPQPGMALLAQQDFTDIDFSRSVMVGNRMSDMNFGRNAGMHTVYVQTTHPRQLLPDPLVDLPFRDLADFAAHCC